MLSKRIDENITALENAFEGCGDFVKRKFSAGMDHTMVLYVAYLDMMIDRTLIDLTVTKRLIGLGAYGRSETVPVDGQAAFEWVKDRCLATVDFKETNDLDTITGDMMAGDTVLFVDGCDTAIVISTKGFPNRGVQTADTEVVVHGSKEAFSEVFRFNTALVRRRIRDTRLKVKQMQIGRRSRTDVALMYMSDIVRPSILQALEHRLQSIDIDGILDSGYVEQLIETSWCSPFPQLQATERPDKAAASILEGRVVILVDNSPFALIAPVTLNTFFQASDDYYNRWQIATFTRLIRYAAGFMAVALPGLYIAIAVYHPSMIPLPLIIKMAEARQAVPFPAIVEILLMDLAFELLREASIRLPGATGGTIGIVGGLIVGQAAVEAGLVSPVVVIVTALAGISSFAIPHVSLVAGFRLVKYVMLIGASLLGLLGFWAAMLFMLTHLATLTSFGVPYLFPFVSGEMNHYSDYKDSLFRRPLFTMKKRPFFANPNQSERMKV